MQADLDFALTEKIGTKMLAGEVRENDFRDVFQLFFQICNSDDILNFTLKGYTKSFQFIFNEYEFVIAFRNGACSTREGRMELPDVTFKIEKEVALDILNGRVYSAVAHMNGDVDYTGYKDDAVRFQSILEEVLDGIMKQAQMQEEKK